MAGQGWSRAVSQRRKERRIERSQWCWTAGARAELWTPQTERALGPGPASKHSSPRRLGLAALPGWGRQGTKGPDPVIV